MSFRAGISWATAKPSFSFIPKLRKEAAQFTLDIAVAVWEGAVDRTPVHSGELRASWNISPGKPSYEVHGLPDRAADSISPLPKPGLPLLKVGSLRRPKFFVSNGKTYASLVEYGSATNVPRLMLTRAIMSVDF